MGDDSPLAPHRASPVEVRAQIKAMRGGSPYLIYRDSSDQQHLVLLDGGQSSLTVGRWASNDIALDWDDEVSRVHAELHRVGEAWTVTDDGLSSNGLFVNGIRQSGRKRLCDGDNLRLGATVIVYRNPGERQSSGTSSTPSGQRVELSDAQRRVLLALCRPYRDARPFATPAKNKEIADGLFLSVEAVKSTLRTLFHKFDLENLAQNEKRAALVKQAFQRGVINHADLE